MTTWPDENADDEFEFYDPADAGPPSESPEPATPTAEVDPTVPTEADEPWDQGERARAEAAVPEGIADGAISDPSGSVHLWLDDERRVTAVRISNRWRERLRKAKQTLPDVLGGLLRDCQINVGGRGSVETPVESASTTARLNEATLDRLMEQSLALDRAASDLRARTDVRPTTLIAPPVLGTSENRLVRVTLDVWARSMKVEIDQDWLERATAATLGEAVLQAHRDAYAQWSPPRVEPGEWDQLNAERHAISAEIANLMRNGF